MSIKVSIIVPIYNIETYLSKCVNSLLVQTLEEIEIILVNDGSTDNSLQLAKEFKEKDARIILLDKENGGLSDARNAGVKTAKGEYLAFVDSDDWVENTMMEDMYKKAIENNAEIAFCDLERVNQEEKILGDLKQSPQLPDIIQLEKDFTVFGEMSCFACNKIFKRELFENIEFPKGLHFEDIATIPRLFLKATTVVKINKPYYKYFVRTGSISKNYTEKGLDIFKAIEMVKVDFIKSNYSNNKKDWKNFVILQGFYSFLAYYAYVKDRIIKKNMINSLRELIKKEIISKKEVYFLDRFGKSYINSLSFFKRGYYLLKLVQL